MIEKARERFRACVSAESKRRIRQEFDYKFSFGKYGEKGEDSYQWNEADKDLRKGRPLMTNNRIGPHVRQTVNLIRQARQAVKVNPVDSGADKKKAEVRQGIFRRIETESNADVAYLMMADQQVRMGESYVRVRPDYYGDGPEQELFIEAIENRFAVYLDPGATKHDGSNARFGFIVQDLTSDEYDEQYPESEAASLTEFSSIGDDVPHWFPKGIKRVAEYFYVKSTWKTVSVNPKESRRIESRQVCWIKMNGIEVLERAELPPKVVWIPVVRCVGEVCNINGEIDYRGCVTDAIDQQKMLNYQDSSIVEMIATGSKTPWIGYSASFAGHPEWEDANIKTYAKLEVNEVDPQNKQFGLLPLPMRNTAEPPIQAMVLLSQRSENNLRAALGVNDVGAEERRKEQSGKAIVARQRQDEMTNGHFAENAALAVRQVGRICNAWMEYIYDAPRTMEIVGADERARTVTVHAGAQMAPPPPPPQQSQPGQPQEPPPEVFDLAIGRYDVTISVGPSYQTRRQEAVDAMTQVVTAKPELLQFIGDLYFGNMDWSEAQQIAERFKKMLPPELKDDKQDAAASLQQAQQVMKQMQQQIQLLSKELDERVKQVETDSVKAAATKDLQVTLQQMKEAAQLKLEAMKLEVEADRELALQVMKNATTIAVAHIGASVKGAALDAHAAEEQQALGHDASENEATRRQEATENQASRQHEAEMTDRQHTQALESQAHEAALQPPESEGA